MGLFFKSKEEKEEIRKRRTLQMQADREAIWNSPVTQVIRDFLREEFTGEGQGDILNDFRSCDFATLNIYRTGVDITIFHKRKKPDGSKTTRYGIINFESVGYSDLKSVMIGELKKALFEELAMLDCMQVKDVGGDNLYLYPIKKDW